MTGIPKPRKGKVIVFGILFFYPLAGVTYQFLHYLIGLRRLGYDPYYVEDSQRLVYDPTINDLTPAADNNINAIAPVLAAHGFADRWAFRGKYDGGKCYGLSEAQLDALYDEADAMLNVTGAQEIRDEHRKIPRRIYVESDPFAWQAKAVMGDPKVLSQLEAHDTHFSFGENIGAPDCTVPKTRFHFQPTRQPVVTDLWDHHLPPGEAYNTITTWSNRNNDLEYNGQRYYWTKDREFEKLIDLPTHRSVAFELATTVPPDVRKRLLENRWRLSDSIQVSQDIEHYRRYIQQARGEFTVARDQYVRPRTGWFSDRSVCYLAAGRPVITQETGFSKYVATGEGLFGFESMQDVLAAIDRIESDYPRACRAARDVAREYFEAEKVVASLMQRAGL